MKALSAYRAAQKPRTPRIEVVLTWYEQVIERLDKARLQLDHPARKQWLTEARLLLAAQIAGINPDGGALEANFFRLYEYLHFLVNDPTPERLVEALQLLNELRESFGTIREQALELERAGQLPDTDASAAVSYVA